MTSSCNNLEHAAASHANSALRRIAIVTNTLQSKLSVHVLVVAASFATEASASVLADTTRSNASNVSHKPTLLVSTTGGAVNNRRLIARSFSSTHVNHGYTIEIEKKIIQEYW